MLKKVPCLIVSLLFATPALAIEIYRAQRVAEVHENPSVDSPIIYRLQSGEEFKVSGKEKGKWLKVHFSSQVVGYVQEIEALPIFGETGTSERPPQPKSPLGTRQLRTMLPYEDSGRGEIGTKPKHRNAIPTDMSPGNPEADKSQNTSQKPISEPLKRIGSGCDETFITDVRHEGAIVATGDGHLFEIDEIDRIDSSLWLVADDLLVCWETYIHEGNKVTLYTIRNGEDKVDASRIR